MPSLSSLARLRQQRPLVQCVTNYVAMQIAANCLLAIGASPAMVHDEAEAGDFTAIAASLTINIGTLSPDWLSGMLAAAETAHGLQKPWVLDPVAHFATPFRRRAVNALMAWKPTIIRGNASEIIALAGGEARGQGADSGDSVSDAEKAALSLAEQHHCVIAVTGVTDFITDGKRSVHLHGGSCWMPMVTALGCSLTAVVGAFVAIAPDAPFDATTAALESFKTAGARAHARADGPGSFSVAFLDELARLSP